MLGDAFVDSFVAAAQQDDPIKLREAPRRVLLE